MSGYLIIRLKGLGDIIHLLPSLQMLRDNEPDISIGFVCQYPFGQVIPKELKIEIFQLVAHAGIGETYKILKQIRKKKYSKLFDLFGNPRTAVLSFLTQIPERFCFDYRVRRYAYSKTYAPDDANLHLMELFHKYFEYFGMIGSISEPNLHLTDFVMAKAEVIISNDANKAMPLLGINPHTTYPSKAWSTDNFIKFVNLWYEKTGQKSLITWGPGEKEKTMSIIDEIGSEKIFTHPEITIPEFAALLSKLDLFLTADTGPMNIAWGVKTPTITLFGPTTRKAVSPIGDQHLTLFRSDVSCLQCHKEVCDDMQCMDKMTPEWVFAKVYKKYLEGKT